MNNKQNYNFEELYLLKLSDLNIINDCNLWNKNNFNQNIGEYFFMSQNTENIKQTILVRVVNKNGTQYLEDILTETRIIIFADYASKSITTLKYQNIPFITAETYFSKIFYNNFTINGFITDPIDLNYLTNTLFVNFNNLKTLKDSKKWNSKIFWNDIVKNETELATIKKYIEALKQLQNRNIHNILAAQEYHNTLQSVKQHLISISKDFEGFSKELKQKQIRLTKK